jgi:exodeoxyribonuclease VII large subunit
MISTNITETNSMPHPIENEHIFSVSELNQTAKHLLETQLGTLYIEGEISNFSCPSSGHWYFTLKDSKAQVRCAMFRLYNGRVKRFPENGMQILLKAKVSLYPNRGDYQLIVEQLHDLGAGALQQQFEALKKQLTKEGLFEEKHKLTLPVLPKTIGIITSITGAALQDMLSVLRVRYPVANIIIYPCLVQGKQAAPAITKMLNLADQRKECDVLLLARGGGSMEDLWCFNDEILARALFACSIPTLTGIGHEVDFTIADFIADKRAPTPTAAAQMISPDKKQLQQTLAQHLSFLSASLNKLIDNRLEKLAWLQTRLEQQHPKQLLLEQQQQMDNLTQALYSKITRTLQQQKDHLNVLHHRLSTQQPLLTLQHTKTAIYHQWIQLKRQMQYCLSEKTTRLTNSVEKINLLNPLQTLARGYSITTNEHNAIISQAKQLKEGDVIVTQLHEGTIRSAVLKDTA